MKKRVRAAAGLVLIAALAGSIGYGLRPIVERAGGAPDFLRENRETGYRFISPLLECDVPQENVRTADVRRFRSAVAAYIADSADTNPNEGLSVYFRELRNGRWFSIGDTDTFSPASLMKVPLMIACLKQAERDRGILARQLRFDGNVDHNASQTIKPSRSLLPGRSYTVEDLIFRMIVHSDNNAAMLLHADIDPASLISVYRTLGIDKPSPRPGSCTLSIKTYSSVFRILYNASYLGRELSDIALGYLMLSDYRSGIVAGVPDTVQIAHKFGECRREDEQMIQFHDCGIVYHSRDPYLLCVMSRGTDIASLNRKIADISRILYAEVDRAEGNKAASVH